MSQLDWIRMMKTYLKPLEAQVLKGWRQGIWFPMAYPILTNHLMKLRSLMILSCNNLHLHCKMLNSEPFSWRRSWQNRRKRYQKLIWGTQWRPSPATRRLARYWLARDFMMCSPSYPWRRGIKKPHKGMMSLMIAHQLLACWWSHHLLACYWSHCLLACYWSCHLLACWWTCPLVNYWSCCPLAHWQTHVLACYWSHHLLAHWWIHCVLAHYWSCHLLVHWWSHQVLACYWSHWALAWYQGCWALAHWSSHTMVCWQNCAWEGTRLSPHPAMPTRDILSKMRTMSLQLVQLMNPAPRPHNLVVFWISLSLSLPMTGSEYSPWLRRKKAQGRRKPWACFGMLAVVTMSKLFPGALAVVVTVTAALNSAMGKGRQWQRNHTGLPRKKRRAPMRAWNPISGGILGDGGSHSVDSEIEADNFSDFPTEILGHTPAPVLSQTSTVFSRLLSEESDNVPLILEPMPDKTLEPWRDWEALSKAHMMLVTKSQDLQLDVTLCAWLMGMIGVLNLYLDPKLNHTWTKASVTVANIEGHGVKHAWKLRE